MNCFQRITSWQCSRKDTAGIAQHPTVTQHVWSAQTEAAVVNFGVCFLQLTREKQRWDKPVLMHDEG